MAANLIPLQLDQTSGNLVAKAISGTYVPPSGTGFQFVTGGTPNLTAVTVTQATALLNLFTASLQGLVPASGGGTTNFLRADGTWAAPVTAAGVLSFNTRTGAVTLTNADVTTALGYVPYNVSNPAGYITSAGAVTSALAGTGISVSGPTGAVTISNTGVTAFNTRTGAVVLTAGDVTTAVPNVGTFTNNVGYITQNQAFNVSGDVSGAYTTGSNSLVLTLPVIATAGTYGLVTVNAKGQVTAGSSPTTLAGYGITDGVSSQVSTVMGSAVSLTFSGGGTVHGIPTPAVATDAANKAYVDAVAQGLSWKAAVKAATTVNLASSYIGTPTFTLTASPSAALPSIDSYAASVGDRILVKNQTAQSQNGIYVVSQATAPWILTRSTDFNETTPIDEVNGAAVYVEQGSTQNNTTWTQIDTVVTFDADPIAFTQLSAGGSGTVTSVSVTTANGVSGTVATATTTPAITLTLGAITPTSVASTGLVSGSNLSGTNTGDQTITLTGDVTGSGTGVIASTLATVNGNVGSFTYGSFTVNAKGLITAASSGASPVTSVSGTAASITSTGGTSPVLNLATTAVVANTYTLATITVDSFGRITAASNGSAGAGTVTSVTVTGANGIGVGGSPITSSGTIALSLGAITPSSVNASGTLTGSNFTGSSSGTNTGDQTITLTGDVTGSGTGSFATTLATVNGNVGSFTNASITVDAKGRITAASSGSGGSGTVTSVAFSDASTTPIYSITGSPVTTTGTLTQTLTTQTANQVFAGPVSGGAAQPAFRALVAADIPTNGVEKVVWRLVAGSTNTFTSATPISITSGVAVSNVNTLTATADYAFTGYDHPPVAIMLYGQQTGTNQWSFQPFTAQVMLDTGTAGSPNLISSFASGNKIAGFQTDATATGATDGANTGSYIIVEFKF